MDFRIREAQPDDAPELARLVTQLGYPTTAEDMLDRLEAILEDRDYFTLVAESEPRLAGMVGVRLGRYYEMNGSFAQIAALVVDEAQRGTGMGARLLEQAEAWAASRNVADVWVNSHRRRSEAHAFYRSRGYEATGLRFRKTLEPAA